MRKSKTLVDAGDKQQEKNIVLIPCIPFSNFLYKGQMGQIFRKPYAEQASYALSHLIG